MKKLISFALLAMLAIPVMAGKPSKEWTFTLNDDGECIVEYSLPTSKEATDALKATKAVINRQPFEARTTTDEVPGQSITYAIKKNTKTRYNPFAGAFNEAMMFTLKVQYIDGQILLRFSDLMLENRYEGYGKNIVNESFAGKIAAFEEALEEVKTAKGKAKKEAQDTIDDTNDSLNMCEEEMGKLIKAIQKTL